jgi:hypothetical protein
VLLRSYSIAPGDTLLKRLTLTIAILVLAGPAWAQGSWSEILCADAFVELKPAVGCHKHSDSRGGGDAVRAVGALYATVGTASGVQVNTVLNLPVGDGTFIKAYTSENALRAIKNQSHQTRDRASRWGELRGFADVSYMSYQADGRACVGFDQAGPLFEYGYAWRLVGSACATAVDNPEAFVKAVLGALRIGPPGSNKSAMGEQVQPLSWPK